MSPENQWLVQISFPTKIVPFKGTMFVFRGCIYFPNVEGFLNHEVGGAYSHLNSKSGIQANAPCSAGCKMVGSDMML